MIFKLTGKALRFIVESATFYKEFECIVPLNNNGYKEVQTNPLDIKWSYIARASVNKYECTQTGRSIRIDFADEVVFKIAYEYALKHQESTAAKQERLAQQHQITMRKYAKLIHDKAELNNKIDKINERVINGYMRESKGNQMIADSLKELGNIDNRLTELEALANNLVNMMINVKEDLAIDNRQTFVKNQISLINIEHLMKYNLILHVTFVDGTTIDYSVNSFKREFSKS